MRPTRARRMRKPAELLLVPMIDIFTVLVTFLLMTAVFSRIAVVQLDLPSAVASKPTEPAFRLEVILRKDGLELTNGTTTIAMLPKVRGAYDLKALSQMALSLKQQHPQADSASLLLEPTVSYDDIIQVMDAIRSVELPVGSPAVALQVAANLPPGAPGAGAPQDTRLDLFTKIAVGDAP